VNLTFDKQLKGIDPNTLKKNDTKIDGITLDKYRDMSKPVMFAIVYGAHHNKIAEMLDVTKEEAEDVVKRFKVMFHHVANLVKDTHEFVKTSGYSENIDGRKRRFRYHNMSTEDKREVKKLWSKLQKERNEAVNMHIQGTGATLMKQGLVNLSNRIKASGIKGRILCCIHDEVIVEAEDSIKEKMCRMVEKSMVNVDIIKLWKERIEMKASCAHGPSWYDAK